MRKIVLVTGGAGYLGSVLVGELIGLGYQVRVLDILMFGKESLGRYLGNPRFELVAGDIRDEKVVGISMKDIFAVCHLAALVGEPACEVNPALSRQVNIEATELLLRKAKADGVERFIFTSTCSNYGITTKEIEVDETFPLRPLSYYSQTKVIGEEKVIAASKNSFSTTVLRLATLYGLSPRMRFNLLLNQAVRDLYHKRKLTIYEPNAWRPLLHLEDAAKVIVKLLRTSKKTILGETFNIVGENKRKIDLIAELKKHFLDANIKIVQKIGSDRRSYRVSGKKIRDRLNFKTDIRVSQGISEIKEALGGKALEDPFNKRYSLWMRKEMLKKI